MVEVTRIQKSKNLTLTFTKESNNNVSDFIYWALS